MTLEEAEQKMKTRMKRFEKRVRSMATLQAQLEEDDNGTTTATGGSSASSGMALARVRPLATTKQVYDTTEKADDAFADTPSSSARSRASILAKAAKVKREEGADYVRQFDDDDVDGNDDRLDGQGGEASDRESDDEEVLAAEQAAAEADAAAMERKKNATLQRKAGMTVEEAEEEQEWAEAAAEAADEEDEDMAPTSTTTGTTGGVKSSQQKRVKRDDDSDDDIDDSDLSLDDESGEEDEKKSPPNVNEPTAKLERSPSPSTTQAGATPSNARKRPISPATVSGSTTKKMKTEGGSSVSATSATPSSTTSTPSGAPTSTSISTSASTSAPPPTPSELAEMERLVIRELLGAPSGQPYTSKSLAQKLNKKFPQYFNKRSAGALRDILKKVVSVLPDKVHIILKKEYQPNPNSNPTSSSSQPSAQPHPTQPTTSNNPIV